MTRADLAARAAAGETFPDWPALGDSRSGDPDLPPGWIGEIVTYERLAVWTRSVEVYRGPAVIVRGGWRNWRAIPPGTLED